MIVYCRRVQSEPFDFSPMVGNLEPLRIEILQFAPALGDVEANLRAIREHAARSDADLLVTPELALTGYDIGDDAADLALPVHEGDSLPGAGMLADAPPLTQRLSSTASTSHWPCARA